MKIEQIQYFAEAARTGSFSTAAKNLFISHQGLSDAIQRLENEIGFALFVREKRGVTLTASGKLFYEKALVFLAAYQELQACTQQLRHHALPQHKKVMLAVNPLLFSVFTTALYNLNLNDTFCLLESSIYDSIDALQNKSIHLAIMMVHQEEIPSFLLKLPQDLNTVELFEDEAVACIAKSSPLNSLSSIDSTNTDLISVNYVTSYATYFNNPLTLSPAVVSNDTAMHLKMMRENNALSTTTRKLVKAMYADAEDIIIKPFLQNTLCRFYAVYRTDIAEIDAIIEQVNRVIATIVDETP